MLLEGGHATPIIKVPSELGGAVGKKKMLGYQFVNAMSKWLRSKNVDIKQHRQLTLEDWESPGTMAVKDLHVCGCCWTQDHADSAVRAGGCARGEEQPLARASSAAEKGPTQVHVPPLEKSAQLMYEEFSVVNENVRGLPDGKGCPVDLLEYMARAELDGLFTPQNRAVLYAERSKDFKDAVGLDLHGIRQYPTSSKGKRLAGEMLSAADYILDAVKLKEVRAKEPQALALLTIGIQELAKLGDALYEEMGGAYETSVALKQAHMLHAGDKGMDPRRNLLLKPLLPPECYSFLDGMTQYGAPTFRSKDSVPLDRETMARPYPSAENVGPEIALGVVRDVARGNGSIVSENSSFAQNGSKAEPHSQSAVFKSTGAARPIEDNREVNRITQEQTDERVKNGDFVNQMPPAFGGDVMVFLNYVVDEIGDWTGCDLDLAKVDFTEAFRQGRASVGVGPEQSAVLPSFEGLTEEMLTYTTTFMFGSTGSPGWFGSLAFMIVMAFHQTGPDEPELNGRQTHKCGLHVDDAAAVLAVAGNRGLIHCQAYHVLTRLLFGKGAVNMEKHWAEGEEGQRELNIWGYWVNVTLAYTGNLDLVEVTMSQERQEKVVGLFTDEYMVDVERRVVTFLKHQQVQGLMQFVAKVSFAIARCMSALYAMLSKVDSKAGGPTDLLDPRGTPEEVESLWVQYYETVRFLRWLCKDVTAATAGGSLLRVLPVRKQLELGAECTHLGSDASGGVSSHFSAVAYDRKVWYTHQTRDYAAEIKRITGGVSADEETTIAQGEMIPILLMVLRGCISYSGLVVMIYCDNMMAVTAINGSNSHDPQMRWMVNMCARCQMKYGFRIYAVWVQSKRNGVADLLTRIVRKVSKAQLTRLMLKKLPGMSQGYFDEELAFLKAQRAGSFALWAGEESSVYVEHRREEIREEVRSMKSTVWKRYDRRHALVEVEGRKEQEEQDVEEGRVDA
jgi:hypothetical protein